MALQNIFNKDCAQELENKEVFESEAHHNGQVVKTEIHEFSSVPKTETKLIFNSPEVVIRNTNEEESHQKNALTIDFTDKHSSELNDYHHYHYEDSSAHYTPYGYHPHHRYEYFYHYRPKKRPLTRAEIEKNRKDRIDVFKAFAQSFLNIGGGRNRRSN